MNKNRIIIILVTGLLLLGAVALWGARGFGGADTADIASQLEEKVNDIDITQETTSPAGNGGEIELAVFDAPQEIDGERWLVSPTTVFSGGVAKDGIPPIDHPKFVTPAEADEWLAETDLGVAISIDGTDRFYPFQILVFHEIVNDQVNGQRVLITYCPLCFASAVFDPVVDGERVEFGVSGKLWNSNLVMYDRKNDGYWSQVLGTAIMGPNAGAQLELLPSDQLTYGSWKSSVTGGEVLSKETGATRFYGKDPYGSYYTDDSDIFFPVGNTDHRLNNKDFILGIIVDGQPKAYLPRAIKEAGTVTDEVNGRTLELTWEEDLQVVRIYQQEDDGTMTRINPFAHFWFSWVAAHPDTLLYK